MGTLYIDTTDFNKVTFAISAGKSLKKGVFKIDPHKSHETLGYFEKFLKAQKISPVNADGKIKKIAVNKGPGSFTGVRIGVTMGQALAMAWNIPVKFIARDKFAIK